MAVYTRGQALEQHDEYELNGTLQEISVDSPKYMEHPASGVTNGLRSSVSSSSEEERHLGGTTKLVDQTRPLMSTKIRNSNSSYDVTKTSHIVRGRLLNNHRILNCILFVFIIVVMLACAVYIAYLWTKCDSHGENENPKLSGCTSFEVEDVWVRGFPKLLTESAFRLLDINGDQVLDVLMGFATGADGYNVNDVVCDIYFNGTRPCFGGLLALDGRTGAELWRHYSPHEIFSVNCNKDLNDDGLRDCLVAGRVATFEAINTRDGSLLWSLKDPDVIVPDMNFYTGNFVPDLDNDGVDDIVQVHGGDPFGEPGSLTRLPGKVLVVSGRGGQVLRSMIVPDGKESYYSPVSYRRRDGSITVLYGTGGETHPGCLWAISLFDLLHGHINRSIPVYTNKLKGVMTPPVLIDLTRDGVVDIVFANFNSTVIALDGENFKQLWKFSYTFSETYATPAPGYYNDDDIPDFMIHWQYGPGFPVYYHSVSTVVDGATGKALVVPYIKSSVGAQTSPLTVSVEGRGNDIFLFWNADCEGHEAEGGEFHFVKGTNVHEQSRADVCRLRFKSEGLSRMYALNRHIKPPGHVVYDSTTRKDIEHKFAVNTTAEAIIFLEKHPEYRRDYENWKKFVEEHKNEEYQNLTKEEKQRDRTRRFAPDFDLYMSESQVRDSLKSRDGWKDNPMRYQRGVNRGVHGPHRYRRHVGPHDEEGLQRLISTGTLAPTLDDNDESSIDAIFATYWFYPSKTKALLPQDQECVEKRMENQEERFHPQSKYYGMDHDRYEHTVTDECLQLSQHQLPEGGIYTSQNSYTPYTIDMGQMTVYRLKLRCRCEEGRSCGKIRSFKDQLWTGYMGTNADSHSNNL